ncbi:MAG TPA: alanine racemase [Steroidobacteraceae bacterium]|nr:alanine racemase [Steroidobacteraceae bacterium]
MSSRKWSRRAAMAGAGAIVVGGVVVFATRKSDMGGAHSQYFSDLSAALKRAGVAQPVMIVDTQRLQKNIEAARRTLNETKLALRAVVKSLPSAKLIERIANGMHTQRYMVFNGAMLTEMAQHQPQGDLLLGKPLPVLAAEQFYKTMSASSAAFADPQWLIDTAERLQQYAQLARAVNRRLKLNLEIDVGLHRGGFADSESLTNVLTLAKRDPQIEITGLMGYDAHVPKVPGSEGAYRKSQEQYRTAIEVLRAQYNADRSYTLNAAGSPTYALHAKGTVANEVSVGSAFVKPTDFDLETLTHHSPASYIATPVIKSLPRSQVPGLEMLTATRRFLDTNTERAFFIYGGHWLAKPESPPGLQFSDLYGRSSNQELLTGSASVNLQPDDYVFFRPTQSEAVFLQFGDLLAYDGKEIAERWPTFPVSA